MTCRIWAVDLEACRAAMTSEQQPATTRSMEPNNPFAAEGLILFSTYAALIITIVAVIVPRSKLS